MKISRSLLGLLLLAALVPRATASSDALREVIEKIRAAPGVTAYEKLESLFYSDGAPVDPQDLAGWYSGRQVEWSNPNGFQATLLVTAPPTQRGGPLFPGTPRLVVFGPGAPPPGVSYEDHATEYDRLSGDEVAWVRRELADVVGTRFSRNKEGHLVVGEGRYLLELRRVGPVILLRDYESWHGHTSIYAYYFAEVTPPGEKT